MKLSMWSNFRQLPLMMRLGAVAGVLGLVMIVGSYVLVFRSAHLSSSSGDWANFGSYLAGTLGSLLSLLSLGAACIAYVQQLRASATSALFGEIDALAQLISSCQSNNRGSGHSYFAALGTELWDGYITVSDKGCSDAWQTTRVNMEYDIANWTSVGAQIKRLLQVIPGTTSLSTNQRSDAMAKLQTLISPGIALLLVVDSYLDSSTNVIAMAEEFGLLRSIPPHISKTLVRDGLCKDSAFVRDH
jgi:hypothetical protein